MKLSDVPADTRKRLLAQTYTHAIKLVRIDTHTFLVSSQSQEGIWYETTPSTCPCKGNAHTGYCSHRLRVSYEAYLDRKTGAAQPVQRPTNISRVA